ncbi:MAG: DUF4363 family protein [Clostridia bacterium]|nr:DUF4363 family protein [Clostridia bacterium]
MKSFVVSLILFACMILAIVWNFCYINKTADRLLELANSLPDAPAGALEKAEALSDFWHDRMDRVGFSVGYTVLDRVSEQAATLVSAAKYESEFDYRLAKALLVDAVGDMRRLERFSIGNIF